MQKTIENLDQVPEDERQFYSPAGDGTFSLCAELAEVVDRHAAELVAADEKIAKRQNYLETLVVDRAVRDQLLAAGVSAPHVRGCTAYLRETLKFKVDPRDDGEFDVRVADAYGEVGVDFAVNAWLSSADGEIYRPKLPPVDGPFSERMRALSQSIH